MLIHINLFTYFACVWSQPINPQIQALLIVQRACKRTVHREKPGNLSAHGKLDLNFLKRGGAHAEDVPSEARCCSPRAGSSFAFALIAEQDAALTSRT